MDSTIFTQHESNVRSYCRVFPTTFARAKGATLSTTAGERYIDFFAGAGALNYGHNNEVIKRAVINYLEDDGIAHGLDMYTTAKAAFLETFVTRILRPRDLDYKVQFCGPTGTNAVEAALKLARKIKKRPGVFSFMGGYHGMSLGSLAATANREGRASAGTTLDNVTFMPFPFGFMARFDTIQYIDAVLTDTHSGIDKPAAMILETVQAEGGVVVAPAEWLRQLRNLCDRHDILLICDDIQVGCGRTGPFFSFERAGIVPDIVTLSKSIGGIGFPMSLVLMKRELDAWEPGQHTGTFRGNQLAFVAAQAALDYFVDQRLEASTRSNEHFLQHFLTHEIAPLDPRLSVRGLGMIWGIDCSAVEDGALARRVANRCFDAGLIIECAGRNDSVIKLLPPLTIEGSLLEEGCRIIKQAMSKCLDEYTSPTILSTLQLQPVVEVP